jgi:nucleotide-binding universal stress UspA family protein
MLLGGILLGPSLLGALRPGLQLALFPKAPEQKAMLDESKKAGHSLIIMGVSRRPGDKLFFGDTAVAVFEKSSISIVFLAS